MQTYLIRFKHNREFVGLIWVEKIDDMFWVIDECTDPTACEYARITIPGGLFSQKPNPTLSVPFNLANDDDEAHPLAELIESIDTASEVFGGTLYGYRPLNWKDVRPTPYLQAVKESE